MSDSDQFKNALLLATQTALLNRISPSMRAVLVRGDARKIRIRFVFHYALAREDLQRVGEVKAALKEKILNHTVDTFLEESAFKKVELHDGETFVLSYSRWEKDQVDFNDETTNFRNVDLDLRAQFNLKELVAALKSNILVMNDETEGFASFELEFQPETIDQAIEGIFSLFRLCRLSIDVYGISVIHA